jgi:hypothetical protein
MLAALFEAVGFNVPNPSVDRRHGHRKGRRTWHHAAMSSSIEDPTGPVSSPRLRLLARVIFGLTILGIAGGIWVLDHRCREGRDGPRLPPQLLPVPDHRVHPGDPQAGQRDQPADAGHRRPLRPERVRGVLASDTAEASYGTGVQGMADRLDAIGGALQVVSRKGAGTTIEGHIPTPTSSAD